MATAHQEYTAQRIYRKAYSDLHPDFRAVVDRVVKRYYGEDQ